jgi:hypothetical protein
MLCEGQPDAVPQGDAEALSEALLDSMGEGLDEELRKGVPETEPQPLALAHSEGEWLPEGQGVAEAV